MTRSYNDYITITEFNESINTRAK